MSSTNQEEISLFAGIARGQKEDDTHAAVTIQASPEAVPSTPSWFGEVVLIVEYLRKNGILTKISEGYGLRGSAPGYTGCKRGQVVRTRTIISQAHTFQWLGSFVTRTGCLSCIVTEKFLIHMN